MAGKKYQVRTAIALAGVLMASSLSSVALLVVRIAATGSYGYWFLLWNLFLAWIPLGMAFALRRWLQAHRWRSVVGIILSLAWLGFLPNSFYIVSDFIHLSSTGVISKLFDAVMIQSFALNGLILGYLSLHLVHRELNVRYRKGTAAGLVVLMLMLCSFAIYLGRYLKWNTWDAVLYPATILLDISNRLLRPASHTTMLTTTLLFTFFLTAGYFTIYYLVRILRTEKV